MIVLINYYIYHHRVYGRYLQNGWKYTNSFKSKWTLEAKPPLKKLINNITYMKIRGKVMIQKGLAVAVFFLFIGVCIIPSATSGLTNSKNIITVDDEPGDADFTSIKEAVNYSSPGDIIEVYSGTYPEDGIRIVKENISLLGISHELRGGNDSGKPFIRGNGTDIVILVEASNVIVSNFRIEKSSASPCIYLGADIPSNQNNNTISDCIIRNSEGQGIRIYRIGRDINITNNEISHCNTFGINAFSMDFNIKGNVITDIVHTGIYLNCGGQNISYNTIKRCELGILISGRSNIIYSNDIENCSVGISIESYGANSIIKNNFKNYSHGKSWWERAFYIFYIKEIYPHWRFDIPEEKNRWESNYWDSWIGIGPKKILGKQYFIFSDGEDIYIFIPIPWFVFDWHPAKEPYDI